MGGGSLPLKSTVSTQLQPTRRLPCQSQGNGFPMVSFLCNLIYFHLKQDVWAGRNVRGYCSKFYGKQWHWEPLHTWRQKFVPLQNEQIPASETLTQCFRKRKQGILSILLIEMFTCKHEQISREYSCYSDIKLTVTFEQILLTYYVII